MLSRDNISFDDFLGYLGYPPVPKEFCRLDDSIPYLDNAKIIFLLTLQNTIRPSFWIDGNDQYCLDDFMSSSQITIQNGQVNSSVCKPMGQDGVIYADPTEEDSK